MKITGKLTVAALVTSTAVAVALFLSPAPKAQAQGEGRGVSVAGTIYGTLDWFYEGGPAWVGQAIISFDNKAPVRATFVDRNTGIALKKRGFSGTETISLTFTDGSGSFDILGRFEISAASTPALFALHESGVIDPETGTGRYENISGQVSIKGPAVETDEDGDGVPEGMWISEIHGVVLGLQ